MAQNGRLDGHPARVAVQTANLCHTFLCIDERVTKACETRLYCSRDGLESRYSVQWSEVLIADLVLYHSNWVLSTAISFPTFEALGLDHRHMMGSALQCKEPIFNKTSVIRLILFHSRAHRVNYRRRIHHLIVKVRLFRSDTLFPTFRLVKPVIASLSLSFSLSLSLSVSLSLCLFLSLSLSLSLSFSLAPSSSFFHPLTSRFTQSKQKEKKINRPSTA